MSQRGADRTGGRGRRPAGGTRGADAASGADTAARAPGAASAGGDPRRLLLAVGGAALGTGVLVLRAGFETGEWTGVAVTMLQIAVVTVTVLWGFRTSDPGHDDPPSSGPVAR